MPSLKSKLHFCLRIFLLLVGISLVAAGVCLGEPFYIFVKASTVCLECIGIG